MEANQLFFVTVLHIIANSGILATIITLVLKDGVPHSFGLDQSRYQQYPCLKNHALTLSQSRSLKDIHIQYSLL